MKTLAIRITALFLSTLWLPLTACALSSGPIEGQVLEEGTNRPIAGAVVTVRWVGNIPAFAESKTTCVHVESVVTDGQGKYRTSPWSRSSSGWPVLDLEPVVSAYKPAYGLPAKPSQKDYDVLLAPFLGTREERLRYLLHLSGLASCYSAGDEKAAFPLYKALFDEAKQIAQTDKGKEILKVIRRRAALAWVRTETTLTSSEVEALIQRNPYLKEQLK